MRQRFFITATGTGTGKSFITAALVQQAKAIGKNVAAYKPVISGFDPKQPEDSDTGLLLRSLDLPPTPENIARISPWRFAQALAPSMAARAENRPLDFDDVASHSRTAMSGPEDIVLIEGIGGVMVPLDAHHTVLDWIEAIEIQAVLVTGNYLGSLSHTFTALSVLEQRDIPIFAVIVNESETSTVSVQDTIDEISRWTRLPIVAVTRRKTKNDWRNVKELRPLID